MRTAAALVVVLSVVVACGGDDETPTTAGGQEVSDEDQETSDEDLDTGDEGSGAPLRVPDRFGTATVSSPAHPDCDMVVGGDTVTVEAEGYAPGAEVIVSLQMIDAEASVVATAVASDEGAVAVPVVLPDQPAGAIGGFEVIGDTHDGLLLNAALLVFGDADSCGSGA